MASYGTDGRCLMRALQEELDDPEPADCGRCAVCTAPRFAAPPDAGLVEAAQRHLRSGSLPVEAKKLAPGPDGAMRKIPDGARVADGWALARVGDGGWWPAVERGLRAGRMDDEVVVALADVVRGAGVRAGWMAGVPSASAGPVLESLVVRIAEELGVPALTLLERKEPRPSQRGMANAVQQAANVRGAFRVVGQPPPGVGLLVDDRRFSGWTLAMAGGQLRMAGAEEVRPLVLATTF